MLAMQGEFVAPVKATKETMLTYLLRREPDLIWSSLIPRLQDYSNRWPLHLYLPVWNNIATQLARKNKQRSTATYNGEELT